MIYLTNTSNYNKNLFFNVKPGETATLIRGEEPDKPLSCVLMSSYHLNLVTGH